MNLSLILHNVRSIENVGAIFRTADGAGVTKMYLTGYTPSPIDRFGREVSRMKKTALGATETVPYEAQEDVTLCIQRLKNDSMYIVAVEQQKNSVPYTDHTYPKDVAFIVGNEIEGVPTSVCALADLVVHIPMYGVKESLNVATATGVILFHARSKGVS